LLTAIAQRTRRLRLGSAVSILPLHHPLRIAEDFAMLDVLSGGRLEFGAGRGMVLSGYDGYGVAWEGAQERMKEALTLVERAWTEPTVAFEGRHYRCPAVSVLPRPLQQPRPPIWMPANVDPESFRWAGERGYGLMIVPWVFPPEACVAGVRRYHEARAAAGHAGPGRVMAMYPCHVAASAAQAREQAEAAWHRWREFIISELARDVRVPPDPSRHERLAYDVVVAQRRALFGGPEECIAGARWIAETFGVTHLALTFHFGGIAHADALSAVALWGREVAPALR
jgi:alkanesulfonate monooxygenase SsuD/methylene tetrahydromethanopterin reductase-like flavin-dependent oxidoreductase (luciferase family)